jgi:drug/metabolite transporter (DMT)-like permease
MTTAKIDPTDATPSRLTGMALIIVSSVLISFGGLTSRYIEVADAWQINFHRALSTAAVVGVILLFRYRGAIIGKIAGIGVAGLMGSLLLTGAGAAFMQAITSTTVANTLFTLSAIPFFTAALARIFLGEKVTKVTLITMIVAAIGVGVMVGGGISGGSLYGNVMALVTAIGFSGFAVIVRRYRHIDMLPVVMVTGLMLATLSFGVKGGDVAVPMWDFWMCFIWGGILSGIGNTMFVMAARSLLAAEVTLFMLLEFSLGPLWVWIFVNETPTVWTLMGGVIVILAVLARGVDEIQNSRRRPKRGRLAGPP